ncbi:MAG: class I SAM-dependent methyltransferase, partial [Alphaproteobacteria bacterium]|nr:class I SAM-dependent methyltransferase [Candidatus Fonsibacter sp. PEL55]
FGVSNAGLSTSILLDLCEKNEGLLYSVDINDYSNKFDSKRWKFIHSRDDNYSYIKSFLPEKLDFIYLDTIHKANHVEKIILEYFSYLNLNCLFVIDDTSWLPYLKNREKNHFFMEVNNYETFLKLISIYNSNLDKMNLEFTFLGTGAAKLKKISQENIIKSTKINERYYSFKNLCRKIYICLKNLFNF